MENILSKGKGVSRVEVMFEITADGVTWPSVAKREAFREESCEEAKRRLKGRNVRGTRA